jgi:hypothetical protein
MDKAGAVELDVSRSGIVIIHCIGYHRSDSLAYLEELEKQVARAANVCLLYNVEKMRGFAPGFPMGHIDAFKRWLKRVRKIAVAPMSVPVSLAIATVRLASGANLRGFASVNEALVWCEET